MCSVCEYVCSKLTNRKQARFCFCVTDHHNMQAHTKQNKLEKGNFHSKKTGIRSIFFAEIINNAV